MMDVDEEALIPPVDGIIGAMEFMDFSADAQILFI
jgi:hypothetical protein